MKPHYRSAILALLAAFVAVCLCAPALAASQASKDKKDHDVTNVWMLWIKHGQLHKFETALKQYAAWRKSQNDPFSWHAYEPIVGSDLDYYVVRSGGHTWSDIQAEHDWGQAHRGEDGGSHIGDFVSHESHYYTVDDNKHTHWMPNKNYKYFGVAHYQMKPGTRNTVQAAIEQIQKAVTKAKWPYSYAIEYVIGGQGGMNIAEPMQTLEGMAQPKPSMMDVLTKSLGSKKAANDVMHDFGSSIQDHDFTIYESRPDLMPQ